MKYIVSRFEVWIQPVEVEADSEEQAREAALRGRGVIIEELFEYSHDLQIEDWKAEECPLQENS